jgi:hypothetical protein
LNKSSGDPNKRIGGAVTGASSCLAELSVKDVISKRFAQRQQMH